MSPIISLQRRLREAGRIRLGEKVATKNGKTAPSTLSEFRFRREVNPRNRTTLRW